MSKKSTTHVAITCIDMIREKPVNIQIAFQNKELFSDIYTKRIDQLITTKANDYNIDLGEYANIIKKNTEIQLKCKLEHMLQMPVELDDRTMVLSAELSEELAHKLQEHPEYAEGAIIPLKDLPDLLGTNVWATLSSSGVTLVTEKNKDRDIKITSFVTQLAQRYKKWLDNAVTFGVRSVVDVRMDQKKW